MLTSLRQRLLAAWLVGAVSCGVGCKSADALHVDDASGGPAACARGTGSERGCPAADASVRAANAATDLPSALVAASTECEGGDAAACMRAARMFQYGEGTDPDPGRAAELHDRACSLGSTASCDIASRLYAGAEPPEFDLAEAAARKGCGLPGQGTPPDASASRCDSLASVRYRRERYAVHQAQEAAAEAARAAAMKRAAEAKAADARRAGAWESVVSAKLDKPATPSKARANPYAQGQAQRGAVRTMPRSPPEVVQRIVRQNFGRFRLCYENGLRRNSNLTGRVNVRFVIGRDGSVATATNSGSDLPDTAVVSCVVGAFRYLSFPQPEGGPVTFVYPISLTPGG
jgi:hypothetical protein